MHEGPFLDEGGPEKQPIYLYWPKGRKGGGVIGGEGCKEEKGGVMEGRAMEERGRGKGGKGRG